MILCWLQVIPRVHVTSVFHFGISNCQYTSQMNHRRNYDNLILDIGVFSFTFFIDSEDKKVITSQILVALGSLPLRINQQIWERVMKKMRLNSHPNHSALLKKINQCIQQNFDKLMAFKLQHYSNDSVKELVQGFVEKIMKSLKKSVQQNAKIFIKLLSEVTWEMEELFTEQHPDYWHAHCNVNWEAQHKTAIIQNYLRANAKGHDLHVFGSSDIDVGLGQLWTMNNAFAERINIEWKIDNFVEANLLAMTIVRCREYKQNIGTDSVFV